MGKWRKFIRRRAEDWDLPLDVTLGEPLLWLSGRKRLTIENHRGLLRQTEEEVALAVAGGELVCRGTALRIASLTKLEIRIEGELESLTFYGGDGDAG